MNLRHADILWTLSVHYKSAGAGGEDRGVPSLPPRLRTGLAFPFHVGPQLSVCRAVLAFTTCIYKFISLSMQDYMEVRGWIVYNVPQRPPSPLLTAAEELFTFLNIPCHCCFILKWEEDEVGLRKGRGKQCWWARPTPLWFRGLFAISILREVSSKELAVQALGILAGGASLELRWKVTCRVGEEFS